MTQEGSGFRKSEYPSFEEVVRFHGHKCPGLATGYRVATAAMQSLGVERPYDEQLVAIAETDACSIDAVQVVTGCTAGKGNLIVRDYGKHAFTFYSRDTGRAVRVLVKRTSIREQSEMDGLRKKVNAGTATLDERDRFGVLMQLVTDTILSLPQDEILKIEEISIEEPQKARIFKTVTCSRCGEPVADAKAKVVEGDYVCMPCYEASGDTEKR